MFRASAHLSRILVGAGVTPAVHCHGPPPLAPVVSVDRKGAKGLGRFDRAVDRSRCEADQTSGIASPRGSLACLLPGPRRKCCWVKKYKVPCGINSRTAHIERKSEGHDMKDMCVKQLALHLDATTPSNELYSSKTIVPTLERAFNLDTPKNCLFLSKDGELCTVMQQRLCPPLKGPSTLTPLETACSCVRTASSVPSCNDGSAHP